MNDLPQLLTARAQEFCAEKKFSRPDLILEAMRIGAEAGVALGAETLRETATAIKRAKDRANQPD